MSPSLQASTSDLSLLAAAEAAEAEAAEAALLPPGGSERIRVRAAAASSRAQDTEEVSRFRT
jgi:hypothetical protein